MPVFFPPYQAPAEPTVVRSSFKDIVLRIRDQIVAWTDFDESHVLIVCRDNVPHYSGEQDVVLRVLGERPEGEIVNSAGRLDWRCWRRLRVIVRSRQLTDMADRDPVRLTDENVGHIVLEDKVHDALALFFPQNDADSPHLNLQSCLVATALMPGSFSDPTQDPKHPEWIQSHFDMEIQYSRDLTQQTDGPEKAASTPPPPLPPPPVTAPAQLRFGVNPANVAANTTLSPAVTVRILDASGNLVQNATDAVTLSLNQGLAGGSVTFQPPPDAGSITVPLAAPTSGTLSGTLTRNAAGGVATFADLRVDTPGAGYSLEATAAALSASSSNPFNVT